MRITSIRAGWGAGGVTSVSFRLEAGWRFNDMFSAFASSSNPPRRVRTELRTCPVYARMSRPRFADQ